MKTCSRTLFQTKALTVLTLAAIAILTTASIASAAPKSSPKNESSSEVKLESSRMDKRFGAYVGILGDPHPTLFGVNLAYNVLDYLRASVGYGQITVTTLSLDDSGFGTAEESMTTIGAAAKFLVPGWNLTPTATLGYSHVFMSEGFESIDYDSDNLYVGLGGDWQTTGGFNLGAGFNVSITGSAPLAPYINLGMFF